MRKPKFPGQLLSKVNNAKNKMYPKKAEAGDKNIEPKSKKSNAKSRGMKIPMNPKRKTAKLKK